VLAYHQENPDLAADYFTRALKADPTYMEAMVNLGNCLMKQEEYTQATQCFKKALDRNPHDVSLLNDLANCFIQLEDFPEAEKIYERSYQLDGNQRQVGEALAALKKMKGLGISREAAL
jgi:tetratricopeptide (TPR) repeat protein